MNWIQKLFMCLNGKLLRGKGKKKKGKKSRSNNIASSSLPLTTERNKRKSLDVSLTESILQANVTALLSIRD